MTVPKWGEPGRQEWERRRYRDALYRILDELGVPGSGYPAPVVNAVAIAKEALAVTPTGPALTVPPHTWQYLDSHVADPSIICTVCKKHGPADDGHWILRMNTEGCIRAMRCRRCGKIVTAEVAEERDENGVPVYDCGCYAGPKWKPVP